MSDVRTVFPNMKEKIRRTARGKKPAKYIAGAPSLPEITASIFKEVLVSHEESGQGVKNFYFLVFKEGLYGYLHLRETANQPFNTNCASYAVLQQVYNDVNRMAAWHPNLVSLVESVVYKGKNPPAGSNLKFIEAVKEKFKDKFEIKPIKLPYPKISKWDSKYYGYTGYEESGSLGTDIWYDDPWNNR